ncbi:MAG: hypothetical protein MZV63_70280 [Marinilabiliales bacterium]|nr:hypothetical protein [Marinilabiliales bacterium]
MGIKQKAPLFLDNPSNIKSAVIYDPEKNEYIIYQKVGAFDYRTPVHMSPEEFRKYEYQQGDARLLAIEDIRR